MTSLSVDRIAEIPSGKATPGLSHVNWLVWIDRSGLPAWQIALTSFLILVIVGIITLILNRVPNPNMYSNVIAFVAIICFFLLLYLSLGRGWHADLKELINFDPSLAALLQFLEPSKQIARIEIVLAGICAFINVNFFGPPENNFGSAMFIFVLSYYFLEYLFIIFSMDILARQLGILFKITNSIRIDLLQPDFYSLLGNVMLRFLKLYIFGICVITFSFNIFVDGNLDSGNMLVSLMPFCLPGLIMLGLYMIPYNQFKRRMRITKSIELNHITRAINGDLEHLNSSLISKDASKLTMVDLLYYEDRIKNIKEWPFTDRIRSMIFFGVLPPLTWVIAALIEIFIESVI
ncbi:MAG: hypothetical protein ACI9FB_004164 [Candidatus Azotimanducaceae bacterium]|jgi:hypothetical protein